MTSWQVQDAKARFSKFLDATIENGPQVVILAVQGQFNLPPIG